MKETSLGDEALQGLEEAIRSESPGIEIVDFLGWRVFVEANSVPIYVRGLADGALTLRSPLGTLVEGPDDQYLKLLLYANCGLVVTKGAGFCLDRNGRLSLERTIPGGLVAAELSRVYRRFAEAAVSWSGLVRSQSIDQPVTYREDGLLVRSLPRTSYARRSTGRLCGPLCSANRGRSTSDSTRSGTTTRTEFPTALRFSFSNRRRANRAQRNAINPLYLFAWFS